MYFCNGNSMGSRTSSIKVEFSHMVEGGKSCHKTKVYAAFGGKGLEVKKINK